MSVKNISVESLRPRVPPEFADLCPTVLFPEHISFELLGVSNATSNAIRRVVECELKVKALTVEYNKIQTNEEFIIPEMIQKRIKMIPLLQSCPLDAIFSLTAQNLTADVIDVKSSEMKRKGGKPVFNETFTLFTLRPGKSARITDITVGEFTGNVDGDGMCVLGINAASITMDQQPFNPYTGEGTHCSEADSRHWRVSFTTNGTMPAKAIVVAACDNIIERTTIVAEMIDMVEIYQDMFTLTIPGETHTIGNLFMRAILEQYPDVPAVTFSVDQVAHICVIRVRCNDDIGMVFRNAAEAIVQNFNSIRAAFE